MHEMPASYETTNHLSSFVQSTHDMFERQKGPYSVIAGIIHVMVLVHEKQHVMMFDSGPGIVSRQTNMPRHDSISYFYVCVVWGITLSGKTVNVGYCALRDVDRDTKH